MTIKKAFLLGFLFALHINFLNASTKLVRLDNNKKEFLVDSRKELLKFLQEKSDKIQQNDKCGHLTKLKSKMAFDNQIRKLQSCYACFFYSSDDGKAILESLDFYL